MEDEEEKKKKKESYTTVGKSVSFSCCFFVQGRLCSFLCLFHQLEQATLYADPFLITPCNMHENTMHSTSISLFRFFLRLDYAKREKGRGERCMSSGYKEQSLLRNPKGFHFAILARGQDRRGQNGTSHLEPFPFVVLCRAVGYSSIRTYRY